jgi:5'-nucleotidase
MRLPNDEKLATEVPEIDLIFGGHDHFYDCKVIGTTVVLKSGCDFSNITKVVLNLDDKTANRFQLTKIDITEKSFPADPQMQVIVDENLLTMKKKMEKVLANCCVDLDCRSAHIRVEESCISNFIADVMRNAFSADVAILNSGTIRSDTVYKAGNFTMGNLMDILPFEDNVVVIQVTGEQLLLALENGFSKVPATEGRFPALSGVKVTFDPHAEPMKRVRQVTVGNEPLVTDKLYSVCTKMYMSKGRDGYDSLVGCPYTVNEEQGPMLSCMVMNYIRALGIVNIIKDTKDQIHAKNVFHRLKFHSRRSSYATIAPKIDQRIIRL